MLIRCLLIICLLIVSAMPICTAEKNTDYYSPTLLYSQMQDDSLQEIFRQITINAKDWSDGDTYYIRYTFTNPTATRIDKDIYLADVTYTHCTETENKIQIQGNFDIPRLVIPPYATTAVTLRLPQHTTDGFNQLFHTSFYFSDDSMLYCYSYSFTNEFALPVASLRIEPDKKIYLSIHNRSYFNPISQLSNLTIHLYSNYDYDAYKYDYDATFAIPDPITIDLKPRESKSLHLLTLPPELFTTISTNKQQKQGSSTYEGNDIDNTLLHLDVEMKLNGTSYLYRGSFDTNAPFTNITEHYYKKKDFGIYRMPNQTTPPSTNNAYFLDDSNLYAYIQVQNHKNTPLCAISEQYHMILNYYNISGYHKTSIATVSLPQNLYIAPNESKYFSFRVPLPNDFYKLHPNNHIEMLFPVSRTGKLSYLTLYDDPQQLLQENYTLLADASIVPYK